MKQRNVAGDQRMYPGTLLVIGERQIDIRSHEIRGADDTGRITPKSMGVLLELASAPRQMCTRAELLDSVWPDSDITPDALSHAVSELRKALGDDARNPTLIQTVHGVGYRLIPPVAWITPAQPLPGEATPPDTTPDDSAEHVPEEGSMSQQRQSRHGRRASAVVLVSAPLVALLLLTFLAFWWTYRRTVAESVPRWVEGPLITSDPGAEECPGLSPDGSLLVYTVRRQPGDRFDLQVRGLASGNPLDLTATPDVDELMPAWSPDGAWIAYMRIEGDSCSIERMPATGGPRQRLSGCDRVVFGSLDWAPDMSHLVASLPREAGGSEPRLHRVAIDGAGAVPIPYMLDVPGWDRDPAISPDGSWIAFRRGVPPDYDLFVVPADGGAARRLSRLGRIGEGLDWTADGTRLIVPVEHAGRSELHVFELVSGESRPLGIPDAARPHLVGERMVFHRQRTRVQMLALPLREQEGERLTAIAESTGSVRVLAVSPSGERIAYLSDRTGTEQLWLEERGEAPRSFPHPAEYRITSLDWNDASDALLVVWSGAVTDQLMRLDLASGRYGDLDLERPLLRDVVHGDRTGQVYAILREGDNPTITRLDRDAAGQWLEASSSATSTELLRVPGIAGAFGRTPMQPDRVIHVRPDLSIRPVPLQPRVFGWSASPDGLWYITAPKRAEPDLRHIDLATGEDVLIRPVPHHLPRRRAAMGVYHDQIVIGLLADDNTDIGQARWTVPPAERP